MANLSISEAWNETAAFVKREAQLIFPIGFLLIALPGALFQASVPVMVPGTLPEVGLWLALLPVAIVLTLIGNIAISLLALRPGTSVAESLQHGGRRFVFLFAAALLAGIAMMAAAIPVILLATALAVAAASPALAPIVAVLLLMPLFLFVWTRLILMTPIAAAEEGGPVAIIRRSWELTRGRFGRLLGFLLLLVIVALVVSMAVGVVFGSIVILAAGQPLPGTLSAWLLLIISALVQAVLSSVFAVAIARVYAQLAPKDQSGIFT